MIVNAQIAGRILRVEFTPINDSTFTVHFPFNKDLIAEVKAMEGSKYHGYCDELCSICKGRGAKFWTISRSKRNMYSIEQLENPGNPRYDEPLEPLTWTPVNNNKIMAHQRIALAHFTQRRRSGTAGGIGIGKTLMGLELANHIGGLVLVICPRSVKYVWESEARKWGFSHLMNEWRNWQPGIKIVTTPRLVDFVFKMPLDMLMKVSLVLIDEAHDYKNPQAQRTQAATIISTVISPAAMIVELTGTPSPKDPTDWWSLCELLQPGFLRESSPKKLRERLGIFKDRGDYRQLVEWDTDQVALMYRRLQGMWLILKKEDCFDLPERTFQIVEFPVSPEIKKICRLIASGAPNALSAMMKLRQFSDGFSYQTGDTIFTPKDEALDDELQDTDTKNRLVIYAGFTESVNKIVNLALQTKKWSVLRQDGTRSEAFTKDMVAVPFNTMMDQFQDPERYPDPIVYIGQPEAGGVGVNLQAANLMIRYSNTFNGKAYMQAMDRCYRLGQKKKVLIKDYCWLPTDRKVLENLEQKKELQDITLGNILETIGDD